MVSDAKDALQTTYDTQYAMLQKKAIDLTLANDPVDIHIQSQDIHRGTYSLLTATRRKIEDICQNM
jgi:phenylalanyl-tRNA synthetase alpha subunit